MEDKLPQTSVAVLGTLAEFHQEAIPYNLRALVELVSRLRPDLLCLDLTEQVWQRGAFDGLPPEYRAGLLPLAHETDIVVVPIGADLPLDEPAAPGWRGRLIAHMRGWLGTLHRAAPGPAAANAGPLHWLADVLYAGAAWLGGRDCRARWQAHTRQLVQRVVEAAQRDPGCRILVAVNVRHCHHIRHALRKLPGIRVTPYADL